MGLSSVKLLDFVNLGIGNPCTRTRKAMHSSWVPGRSFLHSIPPAKPPARLPQHVLRGSLLQQLLDSHCSLFISPLSRVRDGLSLELFTDARVQLIEASLKGIIR